MNNQILLSAGIIAASLGLTYIPFPGVEQTLVVVSGTELQEPLEALAAEFERANPQINLELKFQGSQDIVNNFIDQSNDFTPTVLIPANGALLEDLETRIQAQTGSEAFSAQPLPIAETILVGIAWQERGKELFPNGNFDWQTIETAMEKRNWKEIGGKDWGSFDFVISDPTRSNSGQLTLALWAQSELNAKLNPTDLNTTNLESLFSLIANSVYQPPRSTDILLQEFISRGANDADLATVYESIALHRWSQSQTSQSQPYQIYYLDPTIKTVATAAIVRRNVDQKTAQAAQELLQFLREPDQQAVFVQYGFRPVVEGIDLASVPDSPWSQNIPGAEVYPSGETLPPPDSDVISEIIRLWSRAK